MRGLEGRLRGAAASRSRGAFARAIWWFLLGPTLALLWINFAPAIALLFAWIPPLSELIATLGGVTGGRCWRPRSDWCPWSGPGCGPGATGPRPAAGGACPGWQGPAG